MRGKIFLATVLLAVVLISGCTAGNKALFMEASNNLSRNFLELYENYAGVLRTGPKSIHSELYTPLFSEVCPVEEIYEGVYSYYLDGCDFSKLSLLRGSDNYSDSFSYLSLCFGRAQIIMTDKQHSAMSELYGEEKVTMDDSWETIAGDAANKVIDTLAYAYETTIDGLVYGYVGNKLSDDCYGSASCADSLFQKFGLAAQELAEGTGFDDDYLESCRDYFRGIDEENSIGMLRTELDRLFKEVGYGGSADDYVSYEGLCQRFRTVYSRFYEGMLDDVEEPVQRFIIAATFFGLSSLPGDWESFSDSMDQMIG